MDQELSKLPLTPERAEMLMGHDGDEARRRSFAGLSPVPVEARERIPAASTSDDTVIVLLEALGKQTDTISAQADQIVELSRMTVELAKKLPA